MHISGARGVSLLFGSGDNGVGDGQATFNASTTECIANDGTNRTTFIPLFPRIVSFVRIPLAGQILVGWSADCLFSTIVASPRLVLHNISPKSRSLVSFLAEDSLTM